MKKRDFLILGLLILLFIPATMYDYSVSEKIMNLKAGDLKSVLDGFGKTFEVIGFIPAYVIMIMSFSYLFYNRDFKNELVNKVMGVVDVLGAMIASTLLVKDVVYYMLGQSFSGVMDLIPLMVITITFVFIFIFFSMKSVRISKRDEYKRLATMGVWYVITLLVVVNLMKYGFGRMRPFDVTSEGLFTPWYQFNGHIAGSDSFPSGHSAFGATIMMLPLLYPAKSRAKIFSILFAIAWCGMVAVSRVVIAQHFMTDVLFSLGLSYILFRIFEQRIYLKHRKDA